MSDDNTVTMTTEEFDKKLAEAVDAKTSGLVSKRDELLNKVKSQKEAKTELEARLVRFDGIDPDKVRDMQEKLASEEERKLLDEHGIEAVLDRRIEQVSATHKSEVSKIQSENEQLASKVQSYESRISELVIDGQAKEALIKAGVRPEAITDGVMRAKSEYQLEEGKAILRDSNGEIVVGKEGPLSMTEWAEQQKATSPHWWNDTTGGGGQGGNKSNPSNLKRSQMSNSEKSAYISEHGGEAFRNLPN